VPVGKALVVTTWFLHQKLVLASMRERLAEFVCSPAMSRTQLRQMLASICLIDETLSAKLCPKST
jgi:hypothetical protein